MEKNFDEKSYKLHSNHLNKLRKSYLNTSTFNKNEKINDFRHFRIINIINPLILYFKNKTWLTIGDGQYGSDARILKSIENEMKVYPSDISSELLEELVNEGVFENVYEINAESINFDNESFDIVFCKEAYHHFPKAYVGLYEMLRISKECLILLEPRDQYPKSILQKFKDLFFHKPHQLFENVGNFVFTFSENEAFKISTGLQLDCFFYKGYEDFFSKTFEKLSYRKAKLYFNLVLIFKKLATLFHYKKSGHLVVVFFKNPPNLILKDKMIEMGYKYISVPKNPYV